MPNYELYYEQLNVEHGADEETIKKAYKKLALKFHPDKNQGDDEATKKFLEIGTAYEKLIKMLHGEESGDEDDVWEPEEKEAELEMLRRELERERKKEKRRKEQERWEEDFKMEQMKKRMARERQEREDEFRLKEEQIRRERTLREQAMRKRNDRLSFMRRASTSAGLFTSYSSPSSTYTSFSSYSSDNASPTTSFSYSANLASKWADSSADKNGDDKSQSSGDEDGDDYLPFSTYKLSFKGSGLPFSSTEFYSNKKKYGLEDLNISTKETPETPADYISPSASEPEYRRSSYSGSERLSTKYFPNVPRESVSPSVRSEPSEGDKSKEQSYKRNSFGSTATAGSKYTFSDNREATSYSRDSPSPGSFRYFESPPLSSYSSHASDRNYTSRQSSEYNNDPIKSTEFSSAGSASTKPWDFSSNYLSSAEASPIFTSHRSEPFSPPSGTNSSRSTDDLLTDDIYGSGQHDEPSQDSWSKSLPKRRTSRLEEQIEWEKQFHRERVRKMQARVEEEQREEERLKLELKNQQILQNQKKMEKKRWEESLINATKPVYKDHHSTGYVDFKQYHFRSPSVETPAENSNGTSSFTFRYNTSSQDRSPSPAKQFRSIHVQTSKADRYRHIRASPSP